MVGVEVDAACGWSAVLAGTSTEPTADDLAAAGDGESVGGVLPVGPAEPGELTAAHAGGGGEVQRRVEPQVGGAQSRKWRELLGGPDFWARLVTAVVGRGGWASSATLWSTRWRRAAWP